MINHANEAARYLGDRIAVANPLPMRRERYAARPWQAEAANYLAARIAEELGRKVVLNMVMAGFFAAVSGLVSKDAMRKAVETSVPKGTEGLNLLAFEKGYEYGLGKAQAR